MNIAIFTLPESAKNRNINLNDKYQFIDGKFKTSEQDGELIKNILCNYYSCKYELEVVEAPTVEAGQGGDLTVESTKPGEAVKVAAAEPAAAPAEPASTNSEPAKGEPAKAAGK